MKQFALGKTIMRDGKLTQEEIDKLMSSNSKKNTQSSKVLNKFMDKSINASIEALSTALSTEVTLNNSTSVKSLSPADLAGIINDTYLSVKIFYEGDITGFDLLLIKESDVLELSKLQLAAMGMDMGIDNEQLSEVQSSAVSELMNQIMGKSASILSEDYGFFVDITTPELRTISNIDEFTDFINASDGVYVYSSFNLDINGSDLSINILKILNSKFAEELTTLLDAKEKEESDDKNADMISKMEDDEDVSETFASPTFDNTPNNGHNQSQGPIYGGEHKVETNNTTPEVYPYKLTPVIEENYTSSFDLPINQLNDVSIELSVELGRTRKTIEEVLRLGRGSILELNRLSGEPADLYAQGTLIAKTEVVVVKDYFAVKILDIVDNKHKL